MSLGAWGLHHAAECHAGLPAPPRSCALQQPFRLQCSLRVVTHCADRASCVSWPLNVFAGIVTMMLQAAAGGSDGGSTSLGSSAGLANQLFCHQIVHLPSSWLRTQSLGQQATP